MDTDDETFAQIMARGSYEEPPANKDVAQASAIAGIRVQNPLYGVDREARWDGDSWHRGGFALGQQKKLRSEKAQASYDYHGDTADKAYERLNKHLTQSLAAGHAVIELIHGKGTGTLRAAMRGWIRDCSYVVAFAEPRENNGSVLVKLKTKGRK